MTEPLPDKELQNAKEQLNNQFKDTDRYRIITRIIENYTLTCAQVHELCKIQRFGPGAVYTAIKCHPKITDPANFESSVVQQFSYAEDKAEIKKKLNL